MFASDNLRTGCFHFDPSSPVPTKSITQYLLLEDEVSTAGSIYNLDVNDPIGIDHNFSDFIHETISDPLGITDLAAAVVDRVLAASNSMTIVDSFVYAGCLCAGTGGGGSTPIDATFDSTTSKGMAVYVPSSQHADLAKADLFSTAGVIGLAEVDVNSGAIGTYLTEGQITRTDWVVITGDTLLTSGAVYFLSRDTAGGLTTTAPIAVGEVIVRVGRALSTTTLDIEISQPICL